MFAKQVKLLIKVRGFPFPQLKANITEIFVNRQQQKNSRRGKKKISKICNIVT